MKLVEVVSGLQPDAAVAAAIFDLEQGLGQGAGIGEEHARSSSTPHRAALLRRDAGAALERAAEPHARTTPA
ncbi:MAG: hypothetical protein U1F25_05275 [Rubrivivax sp.]